jgi:hypothetical protein
VRLDYFYCKNVGDTPTMRNPKGEWDRMRPEPPKHKYVHVEAPPRERKKLRKMIVEKYGDLPYPKRNAVRSLDESPPRDASTVQPRGAAPILTKESSDPLDGRSAI